MTIEKDLEQLNARRESGELNEEQYELERSRLASAPEQAQTDDRADAPEQRWLGQQAPWPSENPAASWSQSSQAPPAPYGAPTGWPGAGPQASWQSQVPPSPAHGHPAHWPGPQPAHGWQPSAPQPAGWPAQPGHPQQGAPPAQPAPAGWQQQQAQWGQPQPQPQQMPWGQPQQAAPWAQPQQGAPWQQQPPWAQPQAQAPMVPVGMYAPPGYAPPMPQTYMTQAILATMFCCVPLGVVAIVKASQVSSAWQAGDYATANQRSAEARSWVNWSVASTLILGGVYFVIMLIAGIGGAI